MQLKPCKKIRQRFILWLPKDNCNIAQKVEKYLHSIQLSLQVENEGVIEW